ncbi:MAG: hypothetical protein RQ801_14265, partial [Spirochaetaceae bacterium]|nr:hypothetical protein [Spirochaetaceae bacterium]
MNDTPYERLKIVAGDSLLPGSANIPWWFKKRVLTELATLPADITLIDLGAGSSYNTIDFFLSSRTGIVVTTPEPTAMVNGYSFVKNSYYRLLFRLFPSRTPERELIRNWAYQNRDRGEGAAIELFDALERSFPGAGRKAKSLVGAMNLSVLLNDYHDDKEMESWKNLASVSDKNLGMPMTHIGSIPHDSQVRTSAFSRIPVVVSDPDGPFSRGVGSIASRLAGAPA